MKRAHILATGYYLCSIVSLLSACPSPAMAQRAEECKGLIKFEIKRGDGTVIPEFCVTDTSQHRLDIDDMLLIRINRDKRLSQYSLGDQKVVELNEQIDALRKLYKNIDELNTTVRGYVSWLQKPNIRDADKMDIIRTMDESLAAWPNLKQSFRQYIPDSEERLNRIIGPDAFAKMMKEVENYSIALSKAVAEYSADRSPFYINMRAYDVKNEKSAVPLHLDNYDDGSPGEYRLNESDANKMQIEQVERMYHVAEQLSSELNSYLSKGQSLIGALTNVLKSELSSIEFTLLAPDNLKKTTEELTNELKKLQIDTTKLSSTFEKINSNIDDLKNVVSSLKAIQEKRIDRVEDILKTANSVLKAEDRVAELTTNINNFLKELQNVSDKINKEDHTAVMNKTKALIKEMEQYLKSLIAARYVIALNKANPSVEGIGNAAWNFFKVPVSRAKDTAIDLKSERQLIREGDMLRIEAVVFQTDGAGKSERERTTASFDIMDLGWSRHLGANLLFVQRQGRDKFVTAPGVSVEWRYRPYKMSNNGWQFLDFLNPGIGFSAATLTFEEESTQVGIGGHVSVIGGLLTAGVGYNLQVNANATYYYISFNLLEMFNRFTNAQK